MVTSWQVTQRTIEPQEKYSLPLPAGTDALAPGLTITKGASDVAAPPAMTWPTADEGASDLICAVDAAIPGEGADVGDESGVESCALVGEEDGESFLAIISS